LRDDAGFAHARDEDLSFTACNQLHRANETVRDGVADGLNRFDLDIKDFRNLIGDAGGFRNLSCGPS
jgi:hypothetical protein